MQSLLALAKKSEAIRQSLLTTVGTAVTGVVSAVALMYISRVLGPTQFGVFSVGIAIMTIVSRIGDMGLNSVITRQLPKWSGQKDKAKELLRQLVQWKVMFIVTGIIVLGLLVPVGSQLLNFPYPVLIWLALIGSVGLIMYEHVMLVLSALHEFTWVNVLNITQAVLKVVFFFLLGVLGWATALNVSIWYYFAPFITAAWIMTRFKDWLLVLPRKASPEVSNLIKTYAVHAGLGVIAMTLITNIDVLFVQKYLSTFDTGIYAGASRIALFVGFISSAIGGVLNNRVARYHDRATLSLYLQKSLAVVGLAVLGFIAFLPFAKLILIFTIGGEYLSGQWPMILLVANAFLTMAIVPYISFFYAVDHPNYFSIGGFLQLFFIIAGNVLFLPGFGLEAAAWSRIVATCAHGLYTIWYTWYAFNRLPANPNHA
jgi:O-antigen/teichoic acid export membrane protein